MENAKTCGICLDIPRKGERRSCETCRGSFCFHCISQWIELSHQPSCPLCRTSIDGNSLKERDAEPFRVETIIDISDSTEERSTEFLNRFDVNVLLTWLYSKKTILLEQTKRQYSPRCIDLLNDAICSTDLLLKSCLDVLHPDSNLSLQTFAERLPRLEASFSKLFQKVDSALSHELLF